MIVDTSAIVAILRGEPDADRYTDALAQASGPSISAGTYLEAAIVIDANRDRSSADDSTICLLSPV